MLWFRKFKLSLLIVGTFISFFRKKWSNDLKNRLLKKEARKLSDFQLTGMIRIGKETNRPKLAISSTNRQQKWRIWNSVWKN